MKTPPVKTALILAIALACAGPSSTAFAKVNHRNMHDHAIQDPLVYQPWSPSSGEETCTHPLDWRCQSSNGG